METMLWCQRLDLNQGLLTTNGEFLLGATDLNNLAPRKQAQNKPR